MGIFKEFDKNTDGKLNFDEFKQCFYRLDVPLLNTEIEDLFDFLDRDSNGDIVIREFINYLEYYLLYYSQECLTIHSITRVPVRETLALAIKESIKRSTKAEWIRVFNRRTNNCGLANIFQFKEAMDELDVLLDTKELREIFSYYQNENLLIDYIKFINSLWYF